MPMSIHKTCQHAHMVMDKPNDHSYPIWEQRKCKDLQCFTMSVNTRTLGGRALSTALSSHRNFDYQVKAAPPGLAAPPSPPVNTCCIQGATLRTQHAEIPSYGLSTTIDCNPVRQVSHAQPQYSRKQPAWTAGSAEGGQDVLKLTRCVFALTAGSL
eukprot:4052419-Pleurochrysis_carterae.AAC.2